MVRTRILSERANRVRRFKVRELSAVEREEFSSEWMRVRPGSSTVLRGGGRGRRSSNR